MNTITVEDLKAKIDAGEKLNLLDVREPHEHAAFNIGGQLLPLGLVQALMLDEVEHLKEERANEYLEIIKTIIDSKAFSSTV
jgi:rhodanese-related sulfurtransferase